MYPKIGQYIYPEAHPVCESHTAPANVHILCVLGTEASGLWHGTAQGLMLTQGLALILSQDWASMCTWI